MKLLSTYFCIGIRIAVLFLCCCHTPIIAQTGATDITMDAVAIIRAYDAFMIRCRAAFTEIDELVRSKRLSATGNISKVPRQLSSYFWLVANTISDVLSMSSSSTNTTINVCETGYNAGHSAAFFLEIHPFIRYYGWDLGTEFSSAKPVAEMMKKKFGDRFHTIWGDSKVTVPSYLNATGIKCDVISVDGEHTMNGSLSDLRNFMVASKNTSLFLVDDCGHDTGIIKAFKQVSYPSVLCIDPSDTSPPSPLSTNNDTVSSSSSTLLCTTATTTVYIP